MAQILNPIDNFADKLSNMYSGRNVVFEVAVFQVAVQNGCLDLLLKGHDETKGYRLVALTLNHSSVTY